MKIEQTLKDLAIGAVLVFVRASILVLIVPVVALVVISAPLMGEEEVKT
jgi:hypothetical protein